MKGQVHHGFTCLKTTPGLVIKVNVLRTKCLTKKQKQVTLPPQNKLITFKAHVYEFEIYINHLCLHQLFSFS